MSGDKIQYRGAAHALQAKGIETFVSEALERIRTRLGSGFDEMGQHDLLETVNEGMHGSSTVSNTLYLATGTNGVSRTAHAVAVANGLSLRISNTITLPDAPDGTIAYDTSDGEVSTYGSAATAFASETSTRKVITSRKDIVAISVWHQDLEDLDVMYVYGDTARTAIVWSTLTDMQRIAYLELAENNIYNTNGSLFQVVYTVRSLQGLGDTINYSGIHPIGYGNEFITEQYSTTPVDDFSATNVWVLADDDKGILVGPNSVLLPIAVVQRRNIGAYEPTYNPNGTAEFSDSLPWYSTTDDRSSASDCFTTVGDGSISGAASGRVDGRFYDAIQASDIKERRMYARNAPVASIRAHYKRKADAGTVRGFEGVPFQLNATTSNVNSHSQANPTWTTVIATDAVFNTTFASGVAGVLSATKPDGIKDTFPLDRKLLTTIGAERSTDNGANWVSFTPSVNTTTNTVTLTNEPAANIVLVHFETQAHFTEDDVNSKVLDLGDVFATDAADLDQGVLLNSTLIGKIGTSSSGKRIGDYPLTSYGIQTDISTNEQRLATSASWEVAGHLSINLGHNNNSPAVKALDYLSESNGIGKVVYAYKEMIHGPLTLTTISGISSVAFTVGVEYQFNDGPYQNRAYRCLVGGTYNASTQLVEFTGGDLYRSDTVRFRRIDPTSGWGDNSQFEISDNQVADTDDNGNAIVRGTASFETQFFVDSSSNIF